MGTKSAIFKIFLNVADRFFNKGMNLGRFIVNELGFDSWQGQNTLFSTLSRLVLGPSQPPVQWVLGALSAGVMQPGYEADHSPPPSTERLIIHFPICLHGGMLYN
jgi:hypothetical protein